MIDNSLIEKLSPMLAEILQDELRAGNVIHETCQGGFLNVASDHIFVWLKYPFKTGVRENIDGIQYRDIDDPHYWKAEYDDEVNHQTLACNY